MKLEIRYERSFLQDLKALEPASYQRVRQFVFEDFLQLNQLQDLPGLQRMGASPTFYRFTLDNYLVGIELMGEIVKFVRILRQPDI